jgi:hypothetical protein
MPPNPDPTFDLDPDLVSRTLALSGEKSETAAISMALEEFVARREQQDMLEAFRMLEWETSCESYVDGPTPSEFRWAEEYDE